MRRGAQGLTVWVTMACLVASACAANEGGSREPSAGAHQDARAAAPAAPAPATTTATAPPSSVPEPSSEVQAERQRPPKVAFRRKISPEAPLKVAFLGDSVAYSVVPTLVGVADDLVRTRQLPWTSVPGFTGPGFGLTADIPGYNDLGPAPPAQAYAGWRAAARRIVEVDDPDVVLVLLGIWDTIERRPGGNVFKPGTPKWAWWYGLIAAEFVQLMTSRGASVVFLGMPCVGNPAINARLTRVNEVLRGTWRAAPGRVGWVDMSSVACRDGMPVYDAPGPWGPYAVRMPDGIHFSPFEATNLLRPFFFKRFTAMLQGIDAPTRSRVL